MRSRHKIFHHHCPQYPLWLCPDSQHLTWDRFHLEKWEKLWNSPVPQRVSHPECSQWQSVMSVQQRMWQSGSQECSRHLVCSRKITIEYQCQNAIWIYIPVAVSSTVVNSTVTSLSTGLLRINVNSVWPPSITVLDIESNWTVRAVRRRDWLNTG